MKKTKIAVVALALLLGATAGISACGGKTEYVDVKEYELSRYSGDNKDESGQSVYNTTLFYDNSLQQGYPDPQVLDDTARSGYYYLFGTSGGFATMRSKDLAVWENVGPALELTSNDEKRATASSLWAPEVIYDEETKLYYMFFSATPEADSAYTDMSAKEGIVPNSHMYNMYVATSENPAGPYTMVDFSKAENCHSYVEDGEEKGRILNGYNTEPGIVLPMTEEDELTGKYAYREEGGTYYEAAFPHYYARYCLFAPDELYKYNDREGVAQDVGMVWASGYFGNIDPHPFVDPNTGEKYLYCNMSRPTAIMVIHMFDWLTPDWENAGIVTMGNYYTVEDWRNGVNQGVTYESADCNEGPHVLYHEDEAGRGLYYLTFSVNDYGTSNYQVATAISESPTGPFRKLTEAEGGLLLCSSTTESSTISGAGHHSFMQIGDQMFIIYHRHNDYLAGGNARYTAIDEMKWITVKDINGEDMAVPYVNGPTDSLQPLPAAVSGYKNIAPEATVTADGDVTDIACVNDGLLSVHKTADPEFMDYVRETYIAKQTTFTLDFGTERRIRAIMVYNSAFERSIFRNVSLIELTLADGSVRVMRDFLFDVEQYCTLGGENGDRVTYVMSGASVFAEFYEIGVTSVKVTVDVPEGQEEVGISEIKILGK